MPLQRISVKNNDVENWITSSTEPVYTQESSRLGSTSSNISFSNNDICRICHCEADNLNPLLAPCYCSGSLKYVHQACLQQWLTASETRSCELCKFNFIMHTKIKPFNEWRRLDMSGVERRRLCCAVLFHCVAALCVVWSLFVLIDRAAEEVQKGIIAWPFWTKLVVVAVGFTGGAVFMYIQCRQYLHLCNRWRAHNRIILIQNAPEKAVVPPSPTFRVSVRPSMTSVPSNGASTSIRPAQVIANIESNPLNNNSISDNNSHHLSNSNNSTQFNYPLALISDSQQNGSTTSILDYPLNLDSSYVFGEKNSIIASTSKNAENMFVFDEKCNLSSGSSIGNNFTNSVHSGQELMKKSISNSEDVVRPAEDIFFRIETPGFDPLEINIQEMLALDIEHTIKRSKTAKNSIISLADVQNIIEKKHFEKNKSVFKSLPNLNTRNETLLP